MKKIFSFFVLLTAVTMFTACGDEDATYTPTPTLEITKADLMFEATGGSGTIQVNTTGALTASTESSWVTLSVSGNTVNVTVAENPTLDGRSATIILTSNGITSQVSASQKGGTYGLSGGTIYSFDNAARTLNLGLVHTSAVTVKSLCDWLTASFNSSTDEFEINVAKNDSGWRRTGQIAFQTGDIQDTITITQFDFIDCVQGTYALMYYSSGAYTYVLVDIASTGGSSGTMTFTSGSLATLGVVVPITFDASTYSFTIANFNDLDATYIRNGVTYKLNTMVMMTNGSSIYRVRPTSLPYLTASLEEEDGDIYFDMSAVYSTYSFYGLRIGYGTGGYDGYVGAYTTFPYCYLYKL